MMPDSDEEDDLKGEGDSSGEENAATSTYKVTSHKYDPDESIDEDD